MIYNSHKYQSSDSNEILSRNPNIIENKDKITKKNELNNINLSKNKTRKNTDKSTQPNSVTKLVKLESKTKPSSIISNKSSTIFPQFSLKFYFLVYLFYNFYSSTL